MAFPKKKSRKIIVDNHKYLWIVNENLDCINLSIMSAEINGQKLFARFNYNTINKKSNKFSNPFIITPFTARQTIMYGLKKGYKPETKQRDLNLGNLSDTIDIKISGQENTRHLLKQIENLSLAQFVYSTKSDDELTIRKSVQKIINDCNQNILTKNWLFGLKVMVENLHKMKFKINHETLNLIKQIFDNEKIDWKKDFYWIDEFEIIEE